MGVFRRRGRTAGGLLTKHDSRCTASPCTSPWMLPISCLEVERELLRVRPYIARPPSFSLPLPESHETGSPARSESSQSQKKAKRGSREEEEDGQESREVRRRCDYVPREIIDLPAYTDQIPAICGFIGNILVGPERHEPSVFDAPSPSSERLIMFVSGLCKAGPHPAVFVRTTVYIDWLVSACGVKGSEPLPLTRMNVHRIFLVCFVLACKMNDDQIWTQGEYSKLGGVTTKQLNEMEAAALGYLDWRLEIPLDLFQKYEQKFSSQPEPEYNVL